MNSPHDPMNVPTAASEAMVPYLGVQASPVSVSNQYVFRLSAGDLHVPGPVGDPDRPVVVKAARNLFEDQDSPTPWRCDKEAAVLAAYDPAPVLVFGPVGAPDMLVMADFGVPLSSLPAGDLTESVLFRFGRELAHVHSSVVDEDGDLMVCGDGGRSMTVVHGTGRLLYPRRYENRTMGNIGRRVGDRVEADRLRGLVTTIEDSSLPVTLCHNDVHLGNVLMDHAGQVRLLDWESASLGSVAVDLGAVIFDSVVRGYDPVPVLSGYRSVSDLSNQDDWWGLTGPVAAAAGCKAASALSWRWERLGTGPYHDMWDMMNTAGWTNRHQISTMVSEVLHAA